MERNLRPHVMRPQVLPIGMGKTRHSPQWEQTGGSKFWRDFGRGFKRGFTGALDIGTKVLGAVNPAIGAVNALTKLGGKGYAGKGKGKCGCKGKGRPKKSRKTKDVYEGGQRGGFVKGMMTRKPFSMREATLKPLTGMMKMASHSSRRR